MKLFIMIVCLREEGVLSYVLREFHGEVPK